MNTIQIEYCYDCMFLGRALEIAQLVLEGHPKHIQALDLVPGEDGIFSITLNGDKIYVIGEYGIPPRAEEALGLIESNMQIVSAD